MTSAPQALRTGLLGQINDPETEQALLEALAQVEQLILTRPQLSESFMTEKVLHLTKAGGKRFRPLFCLLASYFGETPLNSDVVKSAAVVEMTHLATLYHDDVMDEAERRRGVVSANHRWNNSVAILAGDFLLAQTSLLMAELGVPTVKLFAETFAELVTGQMRETLGAQDADPVQHYLDVVREKTGVLIAASGYLGAYHAGAAPEVCQALQTYGDHLGVVFQIVDDVIDIFSTGEQSGKTPGTDLREGVFTLPVLYALQEEGPVGDELRQLLTGPLGGDDQAVARALTLLGESSGKAQARAVIDEHLAAALAALAPLPDGTVKQALVHLAELTVARVG